MSSYFQFCLNCKNVKCFILYKIFEELFNLRIEREVNLKLNCLKISRYGIYSDIKNWREKKDLRVVVIMGISVIYGRLWQVSLIERYSVRENNDRNLEELLLIVQFIIMGK